MHLVEGRMTERTRWSPRWRAFSDTAARCMVLAVVYVVAARFGLSLDAVGGFATLVWPPTGLALAALALFGYLLWPGVAVGAVVANVLTGAPLLAALGIGAGNTLEAVVGLWLLRRFVGFRPSLERTRDLVGLVFLAGGISTLLGATVGVTSLTLSGIVAPSAYGNTWLAWWIRDLLGDLVVAPLFLAWFSRKPLVLRSVRPRRVFEAAAVTAFFLLSMIVVFFLTGRGGTAGPSPSLAYLPFLPFVWIALRFGQRATTLGIVAASAGAIWGTAAGFGPFAIGALNERLILLQLFLGTVAVVAFFLSAGVTERARAIGEAARAQTEKAVLAAEKAKDTTLLASLGEGVVATDAEGRVLFLNPAAAAILRLTNHHEPLRAAGAFFPDLVELHGPDGRRLPPEEHPLRVAIRSAEAVTTDVEHPYSYVPSDGLSPVPVALTVRPVFTDGKLTGAIQAFRDVTRELAATKAKDEFVSLASHQLRSPLGVIRWNLELLLSGEQGTLSHGARESLGDVYQSTKRLIEFVNSLLHAIRIAEGREKQDETKGAVAHVPHLLREVLDELGPVIREKGVTVTTDVPLSLSPLLADPAQLRQIFLNLLDNAVKYSRPGGAIALHAQEADGEVRIDVSDAGIGIPAGEHGQVFARFFRGSNAARQDSVGSGLGLYVAQGFARAFGGRIWFESTEGAGSTFHMALPAARGRGGEATIS